MLCLMLEVCMIRRLTDMIITRRVLKRFLVMVSPPSSVVLGLFTRWEVVLVCVKLISEFFMLDYWFDLQLMLVVVRCVLLFFWSVKAVSFSIFIAFWEGDNS